MARRLIPLLALVLTATALLVASAAAATTPPPPPGPPSAYVQTANYTDGCTDWSLQSTPPMSAANPKWVFTCTNTYWYDPNDPDAWWESWNRYYWDANTQTAILCLEGDVTTGVVQQERA
jgi:hypothetical protein